MISYLYISFKNVNFMQPLHHTHVSNGHLPFQVHHGDAVASTGHLTGVMHSCTLMDGEFIQRLEYTIHMKHNKIPVFRCITLISTHKTCGPYGKQCGSTDGALEGYNLLYISGRSAMCFDSLTLAFQD